MPRDHLADPRRKAVAVGQGQPILHVCRNDARGDKWIELVVRVLAGLVLDEGGRVPHLSDVVVISTNSSDERIGADHLGGALGKIPDEKGVVISAGRSQEELPQQRM